MANIYIYLILALLSSLPPSHTQTDHYLLYLGDHQLPCDNGDPDVNAIWYKDSQDLSTLNIDGVSVGINGSLQFSNYAFAHTGYYICENATSGFNLFVECGPNAVNIDSVCACDSGHYKNATAASYTCVSCPLSTYKPLPGDHICFPCPTSRLTVNVGSTNASDCVCIPGYGSTNVTDLCVPCPANNYQSEAAYTACIECPIYSATLPAQGEADPEGFSLRSDCVCLFTQGNADNSTCYAFTTKAVVNISEITEASFNVWFERQMLARAEDGSIQGTIDRYLLEVFISNISTPVEFETIDDLIGLSNISVVIEGLVSGTAYRVVVTSFVGDLEGEPSVLVVTTLAATTNAPTTTPDNLQNTNDVTVQQATTTPSGGLSLTPTYSIILLNLILLNLMISEVGFLSQD